MLRFNAETRARIGSRWATSWQLYVAGLPVGVLAHIGLVSLDSSLEMLRLALLWSVVGYGAMGVLWWVARRSLFRHADIRPVPISVVVAFGAVSGGVRAAVSSIGVTASGAGGDSDLLRRSASGAVVGLFLIPLGSYLAASIAQMVAERRVLHERLVAVTAARMESEREGERLRQQFTRHIDHLVEDAAQRLRSAAREGSGDVDHVLRATLDEVIIPEQRRLRDVDSSMGTRISAWTILRRSMSLVSVPIGVVSVAWILLSVLSESSREGLARGLAIAGISSVVVAFTLAAGQWLTSRTVLPAWAVLGVSVVTAAILGTMAVRPVRQTGPLLAPGQVVLAACLLIFIIVVVNSVGAAVQASRMSLEELAAQVDAEQAQLDAARRLQDRYSREAARIVHTDIQGAMEGALLSMQSADVAADPDRIIEFVSQLQPSTLARGETRLEEAIRQLSARWRGMVDVHLDSATAADVVISSATVIALGECVTNAFRHGGASSVSVSAFRHADGDVELHVTDNGTGMIADPTPGLGTEIIGAGATGGWRAESGPGGGVRIVIITLASTVESP